MKKKDEALVAEFNRIVDDPQAEKALTAYKKYYAANFARIEKATHKALAEEKAIYHFKPKRLK